MPEARAAQRLLAEEVTELVHGRMSLRHFSSMLRASIRASAGNGVARAQLATKVLYERDISTARVDDVLAALRGNPVLHVFDASEVVDVPLTKLAANLRLSASNSAFLLSSSVVRKRPDEPVATLYRRCAPARVGEGSLPEQRARCRRAPKARSWGLH